MEELEMETPIRPPESPRMLPFSSVKQEEEEEEGEPKQTDPRRVPMQEDHLQRGEAAIKSPEFGCATQSVSGESSCGKRTKEVEQSRDDGAREEGPDRNPEK